MTRTTFYDENQNELTFWVNADNKLYLKISADESQFNPPCYIVLDGEDVDSLIEDLIAIRKILD